ncbi:MAG: hypothetical protein WKF89_09705, partial [Chitinophagaceae bacterium]
MQYRIEYHLRLSVDPGNLSDYGIVEARRSEKQARSRHHFKEYNKAIIMEYRSYNRLSKEYNQLYMENINAFQSAMNMMCYEPARYVDFYPSFGVERSEKVEFLVYGQAVNSWGTTFDVNEDVTQDKVRLSM